MIELRIRFRRWSGQDVAAIDNYPSKFIGFYILALFKAYCNSWLPHQIFFTQVEHIVGTPLTIYGNIWDIVGLELVKLRNCSYRQLCDFKSIGVRFKAGNSYTTADNLLVNVSLTNVGIVDISYCGRTQG